MHCCDSVSHQVNPAPVARTIWKAIADSILGAAGRLHRYRDARDILLEQAILEQERREQRVTDRDG